MTHCLRGSSLHLILRPSPQEHYRSSCILARRYVRYVIDWVLTTRYCQKQTI